MAAKERCRITRTVALQPAWSSSMPLTAIGELSSLSARSGRIATSESSEHKGCLRPARIARRSQTASLRLNGNALGTTVNGCTVSFVSFGSLRVSFGSLRVSFGVEAAYAKLVCRNALGILMPQPRLARPSPTYP